MSPTSNPEMRHYAERNRNQSPVFNSGVESRRRERMLAESSMGYYTLEGIPIIEAPFLENEAKYYLLGLISSIEANPSAVGNLERDKREKQTVGSVVLKVFGVKPNKALRTWNLNIKTGSFMETESQIYGVPDSYRDIYATVFGDGRIRKAGLTRDESKGLRELLDRIDSFAPGDTSDRYEFSAYGKPYHGHRPGDVKTETIKDSVVAYLSAKRISWMEPNYDPTPPGPGPAVLRAQEKARQRQERADEEKQKIESEHASLKEQIDSSMKRKISE